MEKITIALVDDHKIVRQGLRGLLEKMGSYRVTHEFESGNELLAALPMDAPPQLYIIDHSMPGLTGTDVLKALEEKEEEYRVLLLTQHFDEPMINAAYHHGARGFLHKNCTAAELKFAIDSIAATGYCNVSEILRRVRRYNATAVVAKKPEITLSGREQEFLKLVCDERELTYEQMAGIMNVSVKSIEAYRAALFDKYNIRSKVGLVLFSYKYRLTDPFL